MDEFGDVFLRGMEYCGWQALREQATVAVGPLTFEALGAERRTLWTLAR